MTDTVLTLTQYSEFLGFQDVHSFTRNRRNHPEQFAPSFKIGTNERWFLSTVISFHKAQESLKNITEVLPIEGP